MSVLVDVVRVFVDDSGEHGNPLGIVWTDAATRGREQLIATDLGFSETIFIDSLEGSVARARIFTPAVELPFAGHPTVGLAAWLLAGGDDIDTIVVPAGSVRVSVDGERTFVAARPEWAPPFEFEQLDSPADVEAVDPSAYNEGAHYVWAWTDDARRGIRARMFGPLMGIREDEATGSAAVALTAQLGRDLDIRQGEGSRLHTRLRGDLVEVGGLTTAARVVELR